MPLILGSAALSIYGVVRYSLIPIINKAVSEAIFYDTNGETLAENTYHDHALLMELLRKQDAEGAKNAMLIHIHHASTP